jgi:hypothetical protein
MLPGRPLVLAALAVAAAAAPAQAATTLRAAKPAERDCAARLLRAGGPIKGVAQLTHTPARSGQLTARLTARRGDWDLALFDARSGALLHASATFGAAERLAAGVTAGRPVVAQACRRSGTASAARLTLKLTPLKPKAGPVEPVQLLRVRVLNEAEFARLEATGLDVTHNHGQGFADVVSFGAADRTKLLLGGFTWDVRNADLGATTRRALRVKLSARAAQAAAALPSGRTAYRTLADYQADLKKLADDHPGLVAPLEIGRSIEDVPIQGVEIAKDVARGDDGRPILALFGLHHAREWPSGEMPMEFATDLAKGFGSDARITSLLEKVRVIVVPVVNPDGFDVSRSAPTDQSFGGEGMAYKRKNCRPDAGFEDLPCGFRLNQGIDLNRNYGAYWGGVGASTTASAQDYRGPAPYSEPESEAVHKLSQTRDIVTVISHHTFTTDGVWLRQPGFCLKKPSGGTCSDANDVVPDEAGMKALGDAMGNASGWLSLLGWKIGEITGATEDWNYFATGAYGYTPEQRGTNFHPAFADAVVKEYTGGGAGAHGGVRESLLRAGEQTADRTQHSVISGKARAGTVLRLHKAFETPTAVAGTTIKDTIDLKLFVPSSGEFTWDVNPSTRPLSPSEEAYTVTCEDPRGDVLQTKLVAVARGKVFRLAMGCGMPDPVLDPPPAATPEPTPIPAPTAEPAPAPAATSAPSPVRTAPTPQPVKPRPRLTLVRTGMSARRFNRRRAARVAMRVDGGRVLDLLGRLSDARGRRFAEVRLARVDGDTRLLLKAIKGRPLKAGRYVVSVRARDVRGRLVTARRVVRVTR